MGVFPVHHGTFVTGHGPSGTSAACCRHGVNIVAGASDRTMLAWCAMNEAPNGIWAQEVNPVTGAPVGAAMKMPGSTNAQGRRICDVGQRVPIVAKGGFFFIAAKDGDDRAIRIWRVGATTSFRVGGGTQFRRVGLAITPDGRLWVGWGTFLNGSRIYVRRSNRAINLFGPIIRRNGPANTVEVQVIDLSAQRERLDILATYSAVAGTNLFHAQVLPRLELSAVGGKTVSFRVTDVGDPVQGATISVSGRRVTTDAKGRARIDLPRGRFTATASKANFVAATARVRSR